MAENMADGLNDTGYASFKDFEDAMGASKHENAVQLYEDLVGHDRRHYADHHTDRKHTFWTKYAPVVGASNNGSLWQAKQYNGYGPWQDLLAPRTAQLGATASPGHVKASNGTWGWNQQGYVPGLADGTIVSGLDYRVDARNAESPDATQTIQPTQTVLYVRQTVEDWTATAADNQAILSGSVDLFTFRWDANPATGLQLYMHIDGVWGQKLSNVNFPAGGQVDGQAFWIRLIFDGDNGVNGGANLLQLDYSVDQVETPVGVTTWTNFDYSGTFTAPGHDCWDGTAAANNVFIGRDSNNAIGDPATDNIITHYVALYHGGIDYNATPACGVDLQSAPPSDGLYTGINGETWTSWWAVDPSDGDYNAAGVGSDDPLLLDHTGTDYLYLPGSGTNYTSTPDPGTAGDEFSVRVRIQRDDWADATTRIFASQHKTSNFSWRFGVHSGGSFFVSASSDGATDQINSTTDGGAATGSITDATVPWWVRMDFDSDGDPQGDARLSIYVSNDQVEDSRDVTTWTYHGKKDHTAPLSVYDGTANIEIGAHSDGSAQQMDGKVFAAEFYNDLTETTKLWDFNVDRDYDGGDQNGWTSSETGEIWTINRSTGATDARATIVDRSTFLFDGGDNFRFATPSWLGALNQDFTIAVVFRRHAQVAGGTTEALFDNSPSDYIRLYCDATTNNVLGIVDEGVNSKNMAVASVPINDGNVHVAGIRRTYGSEWKTFVDGSTHTDVDTDPLGAQTLDTNCFIGSVDNPGAYWNGEILGVFLANSALTDAQIDQLCDALRRGAYDDLALDLQADTYDGTQLWKPTTAGQPWATLGADTSAGSDDPLFVDVANGDVEHIFVPTQNNTGLNRIDSGTAVNYGTTYPTATLKDYYRINAHVDGWKPSAVSYYGGANSSHHGFRLQTDGTLYVNHLTQDVTFNTMTSSEDMSTLGFGDQFVWFEMAMNPAATVATMRYSTDQVDDPADVTTWVSLTVTPVSSDTAWYSTNSFPCLFHGNKGATAANDASGRLAFWSRYADATLLHRFDASEASADLSAVVDSVTGETWTFLPDTAATGARMLKPVADTFLYDGGDFQQFTPPARFGGEGEDFTIYVPFRSHSGTGGTTILFEATDGALSQATLYYNSVNTLVGRLTNTAGTSQTATITTGVLDTADGDLHVAVLRRTYGSDIELFASSSSTTAAVGSDTSGDLAIDRAYVGSNDAGTGNWNGEIPCVRIYRSAHTDAEIDSVCTGLIARYS